MCHLFQDTYGVPSSRKKTIFTRGNFSRILTHTLPPCKIPRSRLDCSRLGGRTLIIGLFLSFVYLATQVTSKSHWASLVLRYGILDQVLQKYLYFLFVNDCMFELGFCPWTSDIKSPRIPERKNVERSRFMWHASRKRVRLQLRLRLKPDP